MQKDHLLRNIADDKRRENFVIVPANAVDCDRIISRRNSIAVDSSSRFCFARSYRYPGYY